MPIFALPLAPTASAPQSRVHFSSLPVRKRKRDPSPTSSSSDEDGKSLYDNDAASLAAASTNPNSLTPQEVLQWRLAGLALDEPTPDVIDWPHRGLSEPTAFASEREVKQIGKQIPKANLQDSHEDVDVDEAEERNNNGEDTEEDERRKTERGPRLRLQHLSVLTTILQRCLLDQDYERASRAWSMLVRAQVGGRGIDLRGSGYWMIGAELLMNSHGKSRRRSGDSNEEPDSEIENGRRWGSAAGLEKTKEYYERLILQHPYKRQFHGSVSALDFWPAMIGCEIYGIQCEQKDALRRATLEEEGEYHEDVGSRSEEEDDDLRNADDDGNEFAVQERRDARRRLRRVEKQRRDKDEIRKIALVAYEKIAARLDGLMTTPPYSDSHVLIRLRGMLALCIGDLSVPALPIDNKGENESDEGDEALDRNRRLGIGRKDTERRFLFRQRLTEYDRGRKKQKEEQIRAGKLFDKIEREGGRKETIRDSLDDQDEDEEGFYDAES